MRGGNCERSLKWYVCVGWGGGVGNAESYLKQFISGVTKGKIVCTDVSTLWVLVFYK